MSLTKRLRTYSINDRIRPFNYRRGYTIVRRKKIAPRAYETIRDKHCRVTSGGWDIITNNSSLIMFPFKENLSARQKNKSAWVNTREFIVLHHTATGRGTIDGNIKVLLGETGRKVSCHFIVDTNGEAYKLGDPTDILWHAWVSQWGNRRDLNKHSIGIEVIWPLPWFTDEQKHTVLWLVQHLMAVLTIPKENVIRHKDIAPGRKTDIDDSFFNKWYQVSFKEWQSKLVAKEWK